MYKKTLFAAAVLALASAAHAQTPAPLAAAAPAAAPAPAAGQPSVAAAGGAAINPFVGKPLSLETSQRALEVSKMETSLLEEHLKQATLAEDLKSLPFKKQVETAQATTARLKEERAQKEALLDTKALGAKPAGLAAAVPAARPNPPARPVKKAKPVAKAASATPAPAVQAPEPRVELTSVLNFGGTRSAVLDIDGGILTAKQGDKTPLGTVDIVDDQSVRIGARTYKVHGATLSRVVISDPKPVDPLKMVQAPVPVAAAAPAAGAPVPANFPPAGQMPTSRNGQPSLPPLQLPSGVTLLPPTAR
jgi:hypothetical protein